MALAYRSLHNFPLYGRCGLALWDAQGRVLAASGKTINRTNIQIIRRVNAANFGCIWDFFRLRHPKHDASWHGNRTP